MKIISTAIPDVLLFEPRVYCDDRGMFWESFNKRQFKELTGLDVSFVQDNQSISRRGVLRGLHYQDCHPQGKLVRVIAGEVFDVAVDLRRASPTFGHWVGQILSAGNRREMWIPAGFAHGFLVLSDLAEVFYKVTDYYAPACERSIIWNDPTIGIHWPIKQAPILSPKDRVAPILASLNPSL